MKVGQISCRALGDEQRTEVAEPTAGSTGDILGPASASLSAAFSLASVRSASQYAGSERYSDLAMQKEGFA